MAKTFNPFVDGFIQEVKYTFLQLEFWINFAYFDPRKLPASKDQLALYGLE